VSGYAYFLIIYLFVGCTGASSQGSQKGNNKASQGRKNKENGQMNRAGKRPAA
jgi:hypothetical protein